MRRVLEIVLNAEGTVGGEQKHVVQIIDGLDSSRFAADVVTWEIPPFIADLEERGIDTLALSGSHVFDVGMIRRLTGHIRARRYDLVHAHGHRAGLIGRLAAIRAGVPAIVWTCHVAENKADRNAVVARAYAMLLRRLDRRTDATIAVSKQLSDWLVARGVDATRTHVIYNCVDCAEFEPRSPDPRVVESLNLGTAGKPPIVGTVARLTEQKGLDWLIDAAARVAAARPDVRFVIVGGGPLREQLLQQAREKGVAGVVVFAGERSDIADVIATFDVAVAPSRWEGFSYVPLEAMASRKPMVCSDIPPFREIVQDGQTGLLFPPGSADGLARAVRRVLADPEEAARLAQAGYDLVRREFDLPVMQRRTMEVYETVLGEKA